MKTIHVTQPAIVLLNRHDAGSLLTQPETAKEHDVADYWRERTFVYCMGKSSRFLRLRSSSYTQPVET
jgi:hypothetical protein